VGYDRHERDRTPGERGRAPQAPATTRQGERLKDAGRADFARGREALGLGGGAVEARWGVSPEGDSARPWMPVPGLPPDLVGEPGLLLGLGGAVDLLESESERRRRLRERQVVDLLRANRPDVRGVADVLGAAPEAQLPNPRALPLLERAWRPLRGFADGPSQGSVEVAVGGNGERLDLAAPEVADLVHFTLEKGPEWVYEELSRAREWADRHRRPHEDDPAE